MNPVLIVALADVILFTPAPRADRAELASRYVASCAGAKGETPDCKAMQWQLEEQLYLDLRAGAEATAETWRIAAAADVPQLAVIGLRRVGDSYAAADEAILLQQIDSPFVAVREAAFEVAEEVGAQRVLRLKPRWTMDGHRAGFPIADEIPSAERLGAAVPAGMSFRPFASDGSRAFFTGDEPVDKVAGKLGRRAYTPDELAAEQRRRKQAAMELSQNPQKMAARVQEAMAAGKDPQVAMQELYAQLGGADKDWKAGLAVAEGVSGVRFVPLDDGMTRMALLFKDELLGKTALVFLDVPTAGYLELMKRVTGSNPDAELMMKRLKAEQLLARPTIDGER